MNKLKKLRKELNLSQEQLAKRTNTTQRNISYWENENVEMPSIAAISLASFFNVSVEYLLGVTDDFGIPVLQNNKSDIELIYESLNPRQQERLLSYAQGLLEANDTNLEELKKRQSK